MIHLVMGGARSGKSTFAEQSVVAQAEQLCLGLGYIATATALDKEMEQRILRHQQQRADNPWQLIECPTELAQCISDASDKNVYLVDCLTLWLSNLLLKASALYPDDYRAIDQYLHQQVAALVEVLLSTQVKLVMVSNELGQGVVPLGELNRLFVDHMGWLNQAVAKVAQRVDYVCAGIAMPLKAPPSTPAAN